MTGLVAALRLTLAVRAAAAGSGTDQVTAVVDDLDAPTMVEALAELARILGEAAEFRHGDLTDDVLRQALAVAILDEGSDGAR